MKTFSLKSLLLKCFINIFTSIFPSFQVTFSLLIAAASAQFFPGFPLGGFPFPGFPFSGFPFRGFPAEDQYAASLENAPVGLYSKTHPGGSFGGPFGSPFGGPFGGYSSDVTGASLGGAKVGLYGKEHPQQGFPAPLPIPFVQPIRPGAQRPVAPARQPPKRY